jgi:hypothetical protein
MDIAIHNEASCADSALIVVSGVHGAEGFAGSAVQVGCFFALWFVV